MGLYIPSGFVSTAITGMTRAMKYVQDTSQLMFVTWVVVGKRCWLMILFGGLYHLILWFTMLYYVLLCYAMLYYVIQWFTMLYYVMLCLCYVMLCYTVLILCHAYFVIMCYTVLILMVYLLCYTMLYYLILGIITMHWPLSTKRYFMNWRWENWRSWDLESMGLAH